MSWIIALFSYFLVYALLAALAYRDLKEYILPDYLNAGLALAFMAFHISNHWQLVTPLQSLEGALIGGGLLLLIRTAANKFYNADALGLGDVKLMAAAGLGLGHPGVLMALTVGAFAGMIHGLLMAFNHNLRKNIEKIALSQVNVPAGLGLTAGIALVMLYQFGFSWLNIK
jgi:leader peptidase (prepilin peptidase)/N-methyltransferase